MQQKLVYLHTEKNLEDTKEILKQQGMEIILKTKYLSLSFSDLTEEEQLSYLKTLEPHLEYTADQLEMQEKQIDILARKGNSLSKRVRELLNSLNTPNNTDKIKLFQDLLEEDKKILNLGFKISEIGQNSRDIHHLDRRIECSCLIAKMGTDVIRYLAFKNDPIITITGPNAITLKSTLEKSF